MHFIELLEDRWLLSGLQPALHAAIPSPVAEFAAGSITPSSGTVEVLEFGAAEEVGDTAIEILPAQLPHEVADAVEARFPGAVLVAADLDNEAGTPVYEVSAEFDGQSIGVKLTPEGTIVETEWSVTSAELPRPVLDWIRQNSPGATIGSAKLVTKPDTVDYAVQLATPGQQAIEATLHVQATGVPRAAVRLGSEFDKLAAVPANAVASETVPLSLRADEPTKTPDELEVHDGVKHSPTLQVLTNRQAPSHQQKAVRTANEAVQRELEQPKAEQAEQERGNATASLPRVARAADDRAGPFDEAMRAFVASVAKHANPTTWLPQVAGVISDALPIDIAAVERGLQQLLDEIDSFAERVATDSATRHVASRLVIAAGLITGAQLVLLESRNRKREPVLAPSSANSTWSWVLGAATPKGP